MKIIPTILATTAALFVLSCEPMIHEMPDKKAYDEIKTTYDTESTFEADSQYQELDEQFESFLSDYSYSSYVDNISYYWGRLNQEWAEQKIGESKIEKYEKALGIFRGLDSRSSYVDESLYRIAESLYELKKAGSDIEAEEVISAYESFLSMSPNSSNADRATKKIEELQK